MSLSPPPSTPTPSSSATPPPRPPPAPPVLTILSCGATAALSFFAYWVDNSTTFYVILPFTIFSSSLAFYCLLSNLDLKSFPGPSQAFNTFLPISVLLLFITTNSQYGSSTFWIFLTLSIASIFLTFNFYFASLRVDDAEAAPLPNENDPAIVLKKGFTEWTFAGAAGIVAGSLAVGWDFHAGWAGVAAGVLGLGTAVGIQAGCVRSGGSIF